MSVRVTAFLSCVPYFRNEQDTQCVKSFLASRQCLVFECSFQLVGLLVDALCLSHQIRQWERRDSFQLCRGERYRPQTIVNVSEQGPTLVKLVMVFVVECLL
jgi:hypothetical protein